MVIFLKEKSKVSSMVAFSSVENVYLRTLDQSVVFIMFIIHLIENESR